VASSSGWVLDTNVIVGGFWKGLYNIWVDFLLLFMVSVLFLVRCAKVQWIGIGFRLWFLDLLFDRVLGCECWTVTINGKTKKQFVWF
jgi:hypothetical protein